MHKTSTQTYERAAGISATSRNNIQEFSFWQEKNDKDEKKLNVTCGFLGEDGGTSVPKMNLFSPVEHLQLSDNIGETFRLPRFPQRKLTTAVTTGTAILSVDL